MNIQVFKKNQHAIKLYSFVLASLIILSLSTQAYAASDGAYKWTFDTTTGQSILSVPAIGSDGTIYFGSIDLNLYSLNPDGSKNWNFRSLDGSIVDTPILIGNDGVIYYGAQSEFYALNPNGTYKWSYNAGSIGSSTIGHDGTIYLGSFPFLYALNPDGTVKWDYTVGSTVYNLAIGSDGTIYFGSADNKLYALNPNGIYKWDYTAGDDVKDLAIGSDGTIYFGSANKLYALNPDGTYKWDYTAGSTVHHPAIGSDGTIYFGSANKLYALNPDGTYKWNYTTGAGIGSSTIGRDGTIYFGSADNKLYALNPDGTDKWDYTAGGTVYHPAIGSDGTIYFGDSNGVFYALVGSSGGLAESPWPKVGKNLQNTGRKTFNAVETSATQAPGVVATVNAVTSNDLTNTELNTKYSSGDFEPKSSVELFNAKINSNGACGTFKFRSTAIPTGIVSDLTLMKFYNTTGKSREYKTYAASGPEYTIDGTWWLADADEKHMGPSDLTSLGSNYFVYFVIKDNGDFDENRALGEITDPVAVGVSSDSSSDSGSDSSSDSSSGCVMNPKADFSIELLGLLIVALGGIYLRQRRAI